jgi:hypothetical protein
MTRMVMTMIHLLPVCAVVGTCWYVPFSTYLCAVETDLYLAAPYTFSLISSHQSLSSLHLALFLWYSKSSEDR